MAIFSTRIVNQIFIRTAANSSTGQIILPRPSDFTPQRESVYRGEYTTSNGKLRADVLGWKFADMDLEWDMLPQDTLQALLALSVTRTYYLRFMDASGSWRIEEFMISKNVSTGTRNRDMDGNEIWKNVKMGVRFNVVHG